MAICCSTGISGAEKSLMTLLAHVDAEVTLVVPAPQDIFNRLAPNCTIVILPITGFRLSQSPVRWITYFINLVQTSWRLRNIVYEGEIEMILANSQQAVPYGVVLKLITGLKLVAFARDNLSRPVVRWMYRWMVDHCLCISDYVCRQLPGHKNKIIIFPPIDTGLSSDLATAAKTKFKINPDCVVLGNIGQFVSWKNHLAFIEVAKRVIERNCKVHFVMAGACLSAADDRYRQMLIQLVEDEDLRQFFTFVPFQNDVQVVYSAIDILVHSAIGEPFGRVVAEAMAHARAVVVFDHGGVCEIVDDHINGFVVPLENIDAMVEKCLLLIDSPDIRMAFGSRGQQKVSQSFSIQQHVDAFQQVIQSVKSTNNFIYQNLTSWNAQSIVQRVTNQRKV